jgi:hypothetical protein
MWNRYTSAEEIDDRAGGNLGAGRSACCCSSRVSSC